MQDRLKLTVRVLLMFVGALAMISLVLHSLQKGAPGMEAGRELPQDVLKVLSRYDCPCGACVDQSLADCDCDTAKTIQSKILSALKPTMSEEDVVELVDKFMRRSPM